MEECLGTTSGGDPREEHRKDGGDMLNFGVSNNHYLDNLMSGNNEDRGRDAGTLNHGNASGTKDMDGATVEKNTEKGRESHNAHSIGKIDATGKASKACRGTTKDGSG